MKRTTVTHLIFTYNQYKLLSKNLDELAPVEHLGCVSLGKSKSAFLYPKTDFAFLYLNPKMD